jgi:sRNA-binding protein
MYYHKADRDEFIRYLSEKFPKCFFEAPTQRRPLKRDIIVDLEKRNVLDPDKLAPALDWYASHFAYRYALVAGAERVDLDGRKAGTVTPQEQQEALEYIIARKREVKIQQASVVKLNSKSTMRQKAQEAVVHITSDLLPRQPDQSETVVNLNAVKSAAVGPAINGHANDAVVAPSLHPSLAELQSLLAAASGVLTEKQYEPLRLVLAAAALREIANRAEKLIDSLATN